ncbi:hypothetical protein [Sphingobacterium sp. SGL-16]|uniref:hypothetical protein n=1 Tax=Sphingobacterium sp. SGL-16 TaxID=2710883 RepID=UPI0013E9C14A|nr:hypothetical protein [Sphingobacterium sp. SGL-16]NGM71636.1 hypothetical protein [Sphingobacterium sp. SGL-16]
MNYLIAKKKRTNNTFFSILSQDQKIYEIPDDLENIKVFDTNYKLEEDEWFGIENFNQSNYSIPLLTQDFNSAEHHQIGNLQYNLVKYFCAFQDDYFCFQKFVYSNIITKKWISLSGEPEIKTDHPILIIKSVPDAIYKISNDTLYFKNLSDVKSIFPEIIELYKEATDEETEQFLNSEFISLSDGFETSRVNTANRKRIAMAIETLNNLEEEHKVQIHNYIREYCPELEFSEENNQFSIGNENHLKNLIFGIEQRFYTTIVGNERRLANSISKLNN